MEGGNVGPEKHDQSKLKNPAPRQEDKNKHSTLLHILYFKKKKNHIKKPNHQQTGLLPHSALPIRGKTNKQNSAQISPYRKLTQTTGPSLGGQK